MSLADPGEYIIPTNLSPELGGKRLKEVERADLEHNLASAMTALAGYWSPTECKEYLGISNATLWNLVARGKLPQPARFTRKLVRFNTSEFIAAVQSYEGRPAGVSPKVLHIRRKLELEQKLAAGIDPLDDQPTAKAKAPTAKTAPTAPTAKAKAPTAPTTKAKAPTAKAKAAPTTKARQMAAA